MPVYDKLTEMSRTIFAADVFFRKRAGRDGGHLLREPVDPASEKAPVEAGKE